MATPGILRWFFAGDGYRARPRGMAIRNSAGRENIHTKEKWLRKWWEEKPVSFPTSLAYYHPFSGNHSVPPWEKKKNFFMQIGRKHPPQLHPDTHSPSFSALLHQGNYGKTRVRKKMQSLESHSFPHKMTK